MPNLPNLPLTSRQLAALRQGAAHPYGHVTSTHGIIGALDRRGYVRRTGPETGQMTPIGLVAAELRARREQANGA